MFSHKGKITPVDMFEDGRKPGEFGFDPLGFGKNPADFKVLQVGSPSYVSSNRAHAPCSLSHYSPQATPMSSIESSLFSQPFA